MSSEIFAWYDANQHNNNSNVELNAFLTHIIICIDVENYVLFSLPYQFEWSALDKPLVSVLSYVSIRAEYYG